MAEQMTSKVFAQKADSKRLRQAIRGFEGIPILVVGDLILDEYVWGDVSRISPEAPVPVVLVKEESMRLGGAANVANNLKALGAVPVLCGVIGDDLNGERLISMLDQAGIGTQFLIKAKNRPTTVKTRIIARSQQVVRLDRELARPLSPELKEALLKRVQEALDELRGVIISDYKKGVVIGDFVERLMEMLRRSRGDQVFVAVDPKTGNFGSYKGVDILTPNQQEAESFCNFELRGKESLEEAFNLFKERLNVRYLLITQGANGMTLFGGDGMYHIPTAARKVFDVTGAGDTVISTLTLAHISGLSLLESAVVANLAAGIVVGEVGTTVVSARELMAAVQQSRLSVNRER